MILSHLKDLNEKQREAVEYCEGPELVLAGAGSGKTRVLTSKIAYLISEKDVAPWRILALTFTNKAAKEMRERVERIMGKDLKGMEVSTFHSYGLRFLFRNRDAMRKLGYPLSFVIFDRSDCKVLVKKLLAELEIDENLLDVASALDMISGAKTAANPVTRKPRLESKMLELYEAYNSALLSHGALDFDDLLVLPLHILATDREVLENERARFEWVLVDEYQDINTPQYLLLRCLVDESRRIMVVGDPDQSIYGWRGADMSVILNFENDFRDAKVVVLDQNYRSTANILNGANAVIKNNSDRHPKRLWTAAGSGEKIEIYRAPSDLNESSWICERIESLRDMGYNYGEMAILYRINAMSRGIERALINNGIPYRVIRGLAYYERMEVKDVLSMLRLALNPRDTVSLERVANVPPRGLGKVSQARLQSFLNKAQGSALEVWNETAKAKGGLKGKPATGVQELAENMLEIAGLSDDAAEAVRKILSDLGYGDYLKERYSDSWEERVENVLEILSLIPEGGDILQVLTEIPLMTDQDAEDDAYEKVNLLTLHAAKGLEFPVVFMTGMEDGIFPGARAIDGEGDLSEERRLCYVGMTRARERLYMSGSARRLLFGVTQYNRQSRFIAEVPESCADIRDESKGGGYNADGRTYRRRWRW
jgi:DNA helicase-2/ATP-dependent DNA helicase PcrA